MTLISKNLSMFTFQGADVTLATTPWKMKVNILYGLNAAGTGYTSYNPASAFNSLSQLVADGFYILSTGATGWDLPGALLTVPQGETAITYLDRFNQTPLIQGQSPVTSYRLVKNLESTYLSISRSNELQFIVAMILPIAPAINLEFNDQYSGGNILTIEKNSGYSAPISLNVNQQAFNNYDNIGAYGDAPNFLVIVMMNKQGVPTKIDVKLGPANAIFTTSSDPSLNQDPIYLDLSSSSLPLIYAIDSFGGLMGNIDTIYDDLHSYYTNLGIPLI